MRKKSFADNPVGAPVTVAPVDETVNVVTACVQLTSTSCLCTAAVSAGKAIVPAAKAPVGVRISQTLLPAVVGDIVVVKPVEDGAEYCVSLASTGESCAFRNVTRVASEDLRSSELSTENTRNKSPVFRVSRAVS